MEHIRSLMSARYLTLFCAVHSASQLCLYRAPPGVLGSPSCSLLVRWPRVHLVFSACGRSNPKLFILSPPLATTVLKIRNEEPLRFLLCHKIRSLLLRLLLTNTCNFCRYLVYTFIFIFILRYRLQSMHGLPPKVLKACTRTA